MTDNPRILVVFYSYEGNTRLLAHAIAEETCADILELKPKKDIKSRGGMKYFWGGRQAIMKKKPELHPIPPDKNPENYDLLFIGTPVWAFNFSPAIRTFLTSCQPNNKKIAIFCLHEGGPKDTLKKMEEEIQNKNRVIARNDFFAPLKKDKDATIKRAREWARGVVGENR